VSVTGNVEETSNKCYRKVKQSKNNEAPTIANTKADKAMKLLRFEFRASDEFAIFMSIDDDAGKLSLSELRRLQHHNTIPMTINAPIPAPA
jgi:hypothetical protein